MRRWRTSHFETTGAACEQFAVRDGHDGSRRRHSVQGVRSAFCPGEQDEDGWKVSIPRHARLARAVLRRLRLGAVRADTGQRVTRHGAHVDCTEHHSEAIRRANPSSERRADGIARHRAIDRAKRATDSCWAGTEPAGDAR